MNRPKSGAAVSNNSHNHCNHNRLFYPVAYHRHHIDISWPFRSRPIGGLCFNFGSIYATIAVSVVNGEITIPTVCWLASVYCFWQIRIVARMCGDYIRRGIGLTTGFIWSHTVTHNYSVYALQLTTVHCHTCRVFTLYLHSFPVFQYRRIRSPATLLWRLLLGPTTNS
jgi:hypothetical protein